MMTENPAFLFYSQDFLVGTLALPMEDRGKYITLLCYMHANGRLSEDIVMQLAGTISPQLRAKFKVDDKGRWYNRRLELEMKKRKQFVKSRSKNGGRGGRPHKAEIISASSEMLLFDNITAPSVMQQPEDCASIPPLPAHVKECFMMRGLSPIEAEYETLKFMAHYTATGWKTTRGIPITDWRAAVTNWIIHRNQFLKNKQPKTITDQWLA